MDDFCGMPLKPGPDVDGYVFALVSDTEVAFLMADGQIVVKPRPKMDMADFFRAVLATPSQPEEPRDE